jgi:hypothetical protein
VPVRITDMDMPEAREVDDKLIMLAKNLRCPILTNDYNLNRVAQLQGVLVLNINELANAVKSVLLPGETISGAKVIQEGKELGQGVGYLDDGTMIVVEEGRPYIGQTIPVLVKKVLQKTEGRLVFAQPNSTGEGSMTSHHPLAQLGSHGEEIATRWPRRWACASSTPRPSTRRPKRPVCPGGPGRAGVRRAAQPDQPHAQCLRAMPGLSPAEMRPLARSRGAGVTIPFTGLFSPTVPPSAPGWTAMCAWWAWSSRAWPAKATCSSSGAAARCS